MSSSGVEDVPGAAVEADGDRLHRTSSPRQLRVVRGPLAAERSCHVALRPSVVTPSRLMSKAAVRRNSRVSPYGLRSDRLPRGLAPAPRARRSTESCGVRLRAADRARMRSSTSGYRPRRRVGRPAGRSRGRAHDLGRERGRRAGPAQASAKACLRSTARARRGRFLRVPAGAGVRPAPRGAHPRAPRSRITGC